MKKYLGKIHVEKRVALGFLLTAVVLAVLGVFSFTSTQRLIDTARLLSHTTRVINNAEQVVKAIVDIETGQRGYVITGKEEFLEPYNESAKTVDFYVNILDSLVRADKSQREKVAVLRSLIHNQLSWTTQVIQARRESFERAQKMVTGGEGKRITDEIRKIVKGIQDTEREVFRTNNTISRESLQEFQYSFLGLAVFISLIIVYLFYAINKSIKARKLVEAELKKSAFEARDLYDNAPCGYFSVDSNIVITGVNKTLLRWVGYSEDELLGKAKFEALLTAEGRTKFLSTFANDLVQYKRDGFVNDLEFDFQRKDGTTFPVIVSSVLLFENGEFRGSRTTVSDNTQRKRAEERAKISTQELEAFTYSVSHDLRSPLRSIAGYAQILKEDFEKQLDKEGNRLIDIVISNANRMGQLIDDLLDFSRLGRKELAKAPVEMHSFVENIVQELQAGENLRQINIVQQKLPSAKADSNMIRQVWVNLISNAFKYTGHRSVAEIEIGATNEAGHTCYYVRDNGAGFDMKYSSKLFGVFQRLHKMDEFEGTGVGLALVKTIVTRHGGRVWAQGEVNQGATFYFTLPND